MLAFRMRIKAVLVVQMATSAGSEADVTMAPLTVANEAEASGEVWQRVPPQPDHERASTVC